MSGHWNPRIWLPVLALSFVPVSAAPAGAASAEHGGAATIIAPEGPELGGGGSATAFSIRLPEGAACPGDTFNQGYVLQSFMVPASLSPDEVVYDGLSPIPYAAGNWESFRQPLYDTFTNWYSAEATQVADDPAGPGLINDPPAFNFAVFGPGDVPPGRYHLGLSCTLANRLIRYWDAEIVVTVDPTDSPAQINWAVAGQAPGSPVTESSRVWVTLIGAAAVAALIARHRSRRAAPSSYEEDER